MKKILFKINLPLVGLFAVGYSVDATILRHAIFHTLLTLVLFYASMWILKIPKVNNFSIRAFGVSGTVDRLYAITALSIMGSVMWALGTEIWQGSAFRWNEGNFFGLLDFGAGLLVTGLTALALNQFHKWLNSRELKRRRGL